MAETLVALGRSYEDEKKFDDAQKAYEQCLSIAPYHEEARNSIEYIKTKTAGATSAPTIPLDSFKTFDAENDNGDGKKDKKKRKKERKSRSKKRQRWSSSSSSSSSGGSSSSSSSESSSSSSSGSSRSVSRSPGRKHKHGSKKDRGSLSPLSKRMAQYNNPPAVSATSQDNVPTSSFSSGREKVDDHEMKVRAFLEQTNDDSDYEGKVRKTKLLIVAINLK